MRLLRATACAALLGVLSGCGFLSVPAHPQVETPAPTPPAPQAEAPRTVIVGPGDSVYLIARSSNTPIRAIIEANHLAPPYVLHVGQHLIVPQAQTYTVRMMDTLYGVAQLNGVDASELVRVNDLKPPYHLPVGQVLILPGKVASPPAQVPAAVEAEAQHVEQLPPQASPPAPPAAGASIAAPTPQGGDAVTAVPLPPPAQQTASGTGEPSAPVVVVPSPAPSAAGDYAAASKGEAAEDVAAPPPPAPPGAKVASLPPEPSEATGPGGASGGRFLWPVHGKIVSGYGPKEGGFFNDGINIAVKEGTPVVAADDGVVVYAGNEIRGFGNLVLVKHANGWMTAYAHNAEFLVRRGEEVRRGQAIAKAGASGTVSSPQLHFEIRRGSHAVDPMKYLAELSS